jgi:tetratricopeptide (TPR) repeat protein
MAYGLSGRLDDAKALFEAAIQEDPSYPLYYYNLACTFAELGRMDEAISNLKLGFERRENMLAGETYPNPRMDDSFKRLLGEEKFEAALKEMGFGAR